MCQIRTIISDPICWKEALKASEIYEKVTAQCGGNCTSRRKITNRWKRAGDCWWYAFCMVMDWGVEGKEQLGLCRCMCIRSRKHGDELSSEMNMRGTRRIQARRKRMMNLPLYTQWSQIGEDESKLLPNSNLDGGTGSVFSPRPLNFQWKRPWYPFHWYLCAPQNQTGRFGREVNLLSLLGFETRIVRPLI